MGCDWWHKLDCRGLTEFEDSVWTKHDKVQGFTGLKTIFEIGSLSLACFLCILSLRFAVFSLLFCFFLFWLGMSHDKRHVERKHEHCPQKRCLFSTESCFSSRKRIGSCCKLRQTKPCLEFYLLEMKRGGGKGHIMLLMLTNKYLLKKRASPSWFVMMRQKVVQVSYHGHFRLNAQTFCCN